MAPSQLKRLKSSLRQQGITGPPKSKKQKRNEQTNANSRAQRHATLQGIRDAFNPFEIKAATKSVKSQTTTAANVNGKSSRTAMSRPGVTKSMGEEVRRKTLLPEMQRRNKTGGVVDRRIGEDDPAMNPEDRALQRFTRERQRSKGASLFDLEGDDDDGAGLTHGGQAIDLNGPAIESSDESDPDGHDSSRVDSDGEAAFLKRRYISLDDAVAVDSDGEPDLARDNPDEPARKKSRLEVMKEVVAKAKFHKYERQKAKEDDDDLRDELDKGMPDLLGLLRGKKRPEPAAKESPAESKIPTASAMNPERLAMLNGVSREEADRQYDRRMRQMVMDKRAAPAERTKTVEEKAAAEAQRLKQLEDARQQRMRGETVEDDGESNTDDVQDIAVDDAAGFGFSAPTSRRDIPILDDEDDFDIDDDLIASDEDGSAMYSAPSDDDDDEDVCGSNSDGDGDEENEFFSGILGNTEESKREEAPRPSDTVAFAYECPQTHQEFLEIAKDVAPADLPTVIQRIRALYHQSLSAENKTKLGNFSGVLVDHIAHMAETRQPMSVIETVIRHVHSLTRTFPEQIANAFRRHLRGLHERDLPGSGDVMILTAIGAIYPTSDHFHQVVTPAITLMARWLGLNAPKTEGSLATGAALVGLCVHYQQLSKRYLPEALRFTLAVLNTKPQPNAEQTETHVQNLLAMAELWKDKSAFVEMFEPAIGALSRLEPRPRKALGHLSILMSQSRLSRRPLELHHHKPQAIRSSYPKFEENFNPNRHYDPDKERTEAAKLKKEYKRERKGAMRDLRKDANFMARQQLSEKREADAAYERKYRRLVAEIQGEEGHEAKEYEREKRMRKSSKSKR